MRSRFPLIFLAPLLLCVAPAELHAQGIREHTRLKSDAPAGITQSQAEELTLTLTEAAVRPVQVWVRTAGVAGADGRTLTALVPAAEGMLVKAGQRARAFPVESRSSMYQARVVAVKPQADRIGVTLALTADGRGNASRYIVEIVTEQPASLSVPNEAIIEAAGKHLVYIQEQQGRYIPREIRLGVQGELHTQVLEGLKGGEQVVTFGSFFIDADHKLKGS